MKEEKLFDGSEYKFSKKQLSQADEILNKLKTPGRQFYRYHMIMQIFLVDIDKLLSEGYVIHHIDGNPANDHPSNLMVMTKSSHKSLHNYLMWSGFTPEKKISITRNRSKSRGGAGIRAQKFLDDNIFSTFTVYEFNEFAKYASLNSANCALWNLVKNHQVVIIKTVPKLSGKGRPVNLYKKSKAKQSSQTKSFQDS